MAAVHEVYAKEMLMVDRGIPLWNPQPTGYGGALPGDVGLIEKGRFIRLFNAFKDPDDPENKDCSMPKHFEKLVLPDDAIQVNLHAIAPGMICSPSVKATEVEAEVTQPSPFQRRFSVEARGPGALLYIDEEAEEQQVNGRYSLLMTKYMTQNLQSWSELASERQRATVDTDEIVFVRGCTKAKVWTTVTFMKERHVYTGTMSFEFGPRWISGPRPWSDEDRVLPVVRSGPLETSPADDTASSRDYDTSSSVDIEPVDLRRNQTIFLTCFKKKYRRWMLPPKIVKAAAGPRDDSPRGPPEYGEGVLSDSPTSCSIPHQTCGALRGGMPVTIFSGNAIHVLALA